LASATITNTATRNSRPKNTRLMISRRVKFITSHRPMKNRLTGPRRAGWFM